MNVGQLDSTLETYMFKGMHFSGSDLASISLTVVEGDVAQGQSLASTSVRLSGLATFNGALPPLTDVRAQQGYLLKDLPSIQNSINQNAALANVTVTDVSFNRLSAASSIPNQESSSSNKRLAILLGVVVSISTMLIAAGFLIVRRRRRVKKSATSEEASVSPASVASKASNTTVDVKPGCESLVGGKISLGAGDVSTYTKLITSSPKRPQEISIRQSDEYDDDDDNYLTMDDEIKTTDGSTVMG